VEADLEAVPGVTVERTDGGLVVHGVGSTALGCVVDALEAADLAYESLAWRRPGLEEVYLRLTGERFEGRDPAAATGTVPGDGGTAPGGGRAAGERAKGTGGGDGEGDGT